MTLPIPSETLPPPLRVMIVDDTPALRSSLIRLLARHADIRVVAQAGDGIEALQRVKEVEPDVLLLDIEMPGMNGLEVTRCLSEAGSKVKILILSAYDDPHFIEGVRSYGAAGYLQKETALECLAESIRRVGRGESLFSDSAR
jgi:DNA-binding NarL/FixJ family response regulator